MTLKIPFYFSVLGMMMSWTSATSQDSGTPAEDSLAYYIRTKAPVSALNTEGEISYAPSISADGRTIIYQGSREGKYYLFESRKDDNNQWQEPVPLDRINSFAENAALIGGPSISFDGNILYFFANTGYGESENIFYSIRGTDGWGAPQNIGAPINTNGYEAFPSISADGKTLYFVRENKDGPKDRTLRRQNAFCTSIFSSVKKPDGTWSTPVKLPIPINMECEKAPKIMADGRTLIFSSNRPGGLGGYDMYQSKISTLGDWSVPVPLEFVNTPLNDQLSCISAQGDLMYYTHNDREIYSVVIPPHLRQFVNNVVQGFVRDADTGNGMAAKIRVFDARTSEEVMTLDNNPDDGRYTLVLPTGRSFNVVVEQEGYSSYADFFDLTQKRSYEEISLDIELFKSVFLNVSVSDKDLFEPIVATTKAGTQNRIINTIDSDPLEGKAIFILPIGAIYQLEVAAEGFKSQEFTFDASRLVLYREFDLEVELAPEKVNVQINVTDIRNNDAVNSRIVLRNKDRDEVIEITGNQTIALRAGDRYELEATSDQGYAFNSMEFNPTVGGNNNVNVELQKLEKDTRLTLRDINFETNSAQLSDISFVELQRVVQLMRENPSLRVEIAAHTDDIGSAQYNLLLSIRRAESVLNYLVDQNIDENRFLAKGYGESAPRVPNTDEESRAINRRVELKILGI